MKTFLPRRLFLPLSIVCALAGGQPASAVLTHRFGFNDGTANDSIGGVNGTLMNGATVTGGKLTFNPITNNGINTNPATGQYMALPSNILKTPDFTIETWFTNNGGNHWQRILDFGNSIPSGSTQVGNGFIILTQNTPGTPLGQISLGSWGNPTDTDYVYGPNPFPIGAEHQLVYTHSFTTSQEALYLDGALIGTATAHVDASTANYSNFWVGRSQFLADPFFNGNIDELRTYNNALTAANVSADFQAGPNPVPEPASLALLSLGALLLSLRKYRSKALQ